MKKLITASVILLVILSVSIYEIVYSNKLYTKLQDYQEQINILIDIDEKNIDKPEIIDISDNALSLWNNNKSRLMLFCSHLSVFELDKCLIKQNTLIKINQHPDCKVETETIIYLCNQLKQAIIPNIHNII